VIIIANDRWTLFFQGWRPRLVKTWISGVETAIIHATDSQAQVEELKTRLRYAGIVNDVTRKLPEKKKSTRSRKTAKKSA